MQRHMEAHEGPMRTLIEMLLVLAIIWNLIVPTLARDAEPAPAAPVRLSEAGGGELLRKTPYGLVPLPLLELKVSLEVTGVLVHGVVTQTFRNPAREAIECVYVFPLPERAAVHRMEMRIGERSIFSIIKEKEEAKQIYEQARQEGRKAALLEQERPNLFTTSAANVNPGESVEIELAYLQEIDYDDGEFGLTVPLTLTPRFATNAAGDADRIDASFARPGSAAFPRAELEVRIHPGFPIETVESASHSIRTFWDSDTLVVEPEGKTVAADRDFKLRWRPLLAGEPRPALFLEDRPEGRYVLMMLLPPLAGVGTGRGLPTETLFIVDVSGSMAGPSIEQARAALLAALDRLRPEDTFGILSFSEAVTPFRPGFIAASGGNLDEARAWTRSLRVESGTRIDLALASGLSLIRSSRSSRLQRIIFLTDGAADNEDAILQDVRSGLGAARLHTLGIGAAPNRYLMRKMAAAGRGLCEFISTTDGAANRVDAFLTRLDRPVMTDLTLTWDGTAPVESYPAFLPDLHSGEPLFLSARLAPGRTVPRLVMSGTTLEGTLRLDVTASGPAAPDSGVAVRWGRAKVESLLDTLHDGAESDQVRRAVVEVSTAFGFVSPYTSLVAVEKFPTATGDCQRARIANALPDGSQVLGDLPSGGTDGPILFLLGMLFLFAGSVLLVGAFRLPGKAY
jgi:Ca-activated chloride channel family protein